MLLVVEVKILTENKIPTHWYLRREAQVDYVKNKGNNPDYLSQAQLDKKFVHPSCDLIEVISRSQIIIFAVPSLALVEISKEIAEPLLKDKIIISALKGTVGPQNDIASTFLSKTFHIRSSQIVCIGGPCHAEEIAQNKQTYMTLSSQSSHVLEKLSPLFTRPYLRIRKNDDPIGVAYASIYKNVLGIASGMAAGLDYGDNFMAVLTSNAISEMHNILQCLPGEKRGILNSSYVGDLLVTGYSDNSRNRRFGGYIGRGSSPKEALNQIGMVAEGYQATESLFLHFQKKNLKLPILSTVYQILYKNHSVKTEFKLLEEKLI